MNRRDVLLTVSTTGVLSIAGCLGGDGSSDEPEFDDWFDNVPHFDGFEDRTDQDEVAVVVGDGENGFLFTPPAVTIAPGTTVIFEWTGEGGEHEVAERDGEWHNPEGLIDRAGHTWEREFNRAGTHLYECWPHKALGMKGGIFVDPNAE